MWQIPTYSMIILQKSNKIGNKLSTKSAKKRAFLIWSIFKLVVNKPIKQKFKLIIFEMNVFIEWNIKSFVTHKLTDMCFMLQSKPKF